MTPTSNPNSSTEPTVDNVKSFTTWRWFGLFLIAYFLVWSILPAFLASSVPLDVSEGINWGQEWQWGYYKHPPLSSWILYSFYKVFGHIGPYLLSQICVLLTLFIIYKLGKQLWSTHIALLGSLLTLAVVYYSYPSLEFNHNVAQFPIWAGLYLTFYQAISRDRIIDWLLLGIVGGLGMLTKYSVIFLLLPMAFYLILPKQWPLLKQPQPWIALFTMLAIFMPHLYWLMMNDWLPLNYASGRSHDIGESANNIKRHFSWLSFIGAQLVAHIPLILILLFNRKRLMGIKPYKKALSVEASLLWYMWLAPIGLLIMLSLIFGVGLRDMWGMPMWSLSGLLAASFIVPSARDVTTQKIKKALIIWLVLVTALSIIYVGLGDKIRNKASRMQWPEQTLALQANQTWQSLSNCPLDSVSGDRWLGALVAMNMAKGNSFPSQMISGPASHSPWMNTKRLQNNGTLVMWQTDSDEKVELPLLATLAIEKKSDANNQSANVLVKQQGQWQLDWRSAKIEKPLIVNWIAYVPSRCLTER